jgi:phosphoribosylglycinamide formyltransferase-1
MSDARLPIRQALVSVYDKTGLEELVRALADAGVDTGPIVAQAVVPVEEDDDVDSLHERIKVAERKMLVDNVGRLAREGFTITDRKVRFGA